MKRQASDSYSDTTIGVRTFFKFFVDSRCGSISTWFYGRDTMATYVCDCLNVNICGDAISTGEVPSSPLGQNAVPIELRDGGVHYRQGIFLKEEEEKQWKTFTCLNCHKKTHCIRRACSVLLMSSELKCANDVECLTSSPFYSPFFHILLKPSHNIQALDLSHGIEKYSDLEKRMCSLALQSVQCMKEEENTVECRVRQFELEQHEELDRLKARINEDKKKMMSVLWSNYKQDQQFVGEVDKTCDQKNHRYPIADGVCLNPFYDSYESVLENKKCCSENSDSVGSEIFTMDDIDGWGPPRSREDRVDDDSDDDDVFKDSEEPNYKRRERMNTLTPSSLHYLNRPDDDDDLWMNMAKLHLGDE
ncbi:uncharacterized protein LOC143301284 isoform X2 [Babylonia areolata]|uniref:uncharacterized protein LOC143301284 isoform X2 n=1 Tax=Babylonia areolata TaxID=304850 RepID=UPI003FCEEFDD